MTSWNSDIEQHKSSNSVLKYFAKAAAPSTSNAGASSAPSTSNVATSSAPSTSTLNTEKPKPAQEACIKKIEDLKNEYEYITKKNFKTIEDHEKLKFLKKSLKQEESNLKNLKVCHNWPIYI
uniref:Uncharacterized protein n=1 Tax=Panagrolaimus superbus TaxID=310955 RepID=A0A914ZAN3_9BILA